MQETTQQSPPLTQTETQSLSIPIEIETSEVAPEEAQVLVQLRASMLKAGGDLTPLDLSY